MLAKWTETYMTAIRLLPGDDLKSKLNQFVIDHKIEAAGIVTAVGSLSQVNLRFANRAQATQIVGKHEIVSLTGTLGQDGCHLHVCVSNSQGQTIGGHLLDASIIYTTAEIILVRLNGFTFRRKPCEYSGFNELEIQ